MTGLNAFQQNVVDGASNALEDQGHEREPGDLAARVGRLEWHLAEVLALVAELDDGADRCPVDVRRGPGGAS